MSKTKKTDWWATKWWKQDKKKEEKTSASSYWYDDYSSDFDYGSFYKGWGGVDSVQVKSFQRTQDLYKLNSTRRAIANFVNIVTGRNIPVRYATKSMSHTDGDSVVLSADVNDNFDVSVGLALHEGSHIVLSQFDLLEAIGQTRQIVDRDYGIPPNKAAYANQLDAAMGYNVCKKHTEILNRIFNAETGLYRHTWPSSNFDGLVGLVHSITNWIEDRRIDAYIYKNAPGYRQYYLKLYDHYFNSKDITKGIESDEYTDETIESYIFRIINFTNEKTDLNKLKGLRKIYGMIDLRNINRLRTTTDCMNLAIDVIEEIYRHCGSPMFDKPQGQQPGNGEGDGDSVEITDITDGESNDQGGSPGQIGNGMTGQLSTNPSDAAGDGEGDTDTKSPKITLSKTAKEKLDRLIQKQKDFLNDKIKKKNISRDEEKSLKNIEESGSEMVNVGGSVQSSHDYYTKGSGTQAKGVDCVVVKRVTPAVLDSDEFPFASYSKDPRYQNEVQEGIKLGTMLGNKLSVRSESRDTVFNRLNKGKIDQRLISGLGYGAESVFYTREVDQYKKANLHISIDYSGSMNGTRIQNAIVCTTAIVKAATMARNINVQVSVRSTSSGNHQALPYIALVYDSRRDTFKWFCEVMSKMTTSNTTPEGLCFEAIMKHFVPANKDVDSYFLNLSDGEPCYQTNGYQYSGEPAAQHTSQQVKRMREDGMNILSYFINDGGMDSRAWQVFRKCYGADARLVNPRNMLDIAKTMNEMFLKKGKRTE